MCSLPQGLEPCPPTPVCHSKPVLLLPGEASRERAYTVRLEQLAKLLPELSDYTGNYLCYTVTLLVNYAKQNNANSYTHLSFQSRMEW